MEITDYIISRERRLEGITIRESDDHVTDLLFQGQVIARFSQTGVQIDNVLKEVEVGKYDN